MFVALLVGTPGSFWLGKASRVGRANSMDDDLWLFTGLVCKAKSMFVCYSYTLPALPTLLTLPTFYTSYATCIASVQEPETALHPLLHSSSAARSFQLLSSSLQQSRKMVCTASAIHLLLRQNPWKSLSSFIFTHLWDWRHAATSKFLVLFCFAFSVFPCQYSSKYGRLLNAFLSRIENPLCSACDLGIPVVSHCARFCFELVTPHLLQQLLFICDLCSRPWEVLWPVGQKLGLQGLLLCPSPEKKVWYKRQYYDVILHVIINRLSVEIFWSIGRQNWVCKS